MRKMTLGSLFDGSGGFPLGGIMAGITPVWNSEIEPFPVRVTEKRLPMVKHYGDISTLSGAELPPVDVITFGSPCQDMSLAGRRAGLGGRRSGLFFEAVRIIKEMREKTNGRYPEFIVWENVMGAFSSNRGEDFRAVLREICSIGGETADVPECTKWKNAGLIMGDHQSVAWRVLDAQYWGVPQRRKRIYLVADLAGQRAGKILFESEGVSGYSAQSFSTWQGVAGTAEDSTREAGNVCIDDQLMYENHGQDSRYTGPLKASQTVSSTFGTGGNNQPLVLEKPKTLKIRSGCAGGGKGALVQNDLSATLGCHNDQTLFQPKAFGICSKESNSMKSDNPQSGFYEAGTSRCLDANGGNPACNQGGMAVISLQGSMIGRQDSNGPRGSGINSDVSFTLNTADRHAVAYSSSKASFFMSAEKELANTLVATDYKDPPIVNSSDDAQYIVRRLTPTECARLQGFPDWWCDDLGTDEPRDDEIEKWRMVFDEYASATGMRSKPKSDRQIRRWLRDPYSDSAAYKMWGNGVALPCVCFVLCGIVSNAQ